METEKNGGQEAAAGIGLLKDMTVAIIELKKVVDAWIRAAIGDEETGGLLERLLSLEESIDSLDTRMIGMNFMLARYAFVFDRMLEVHKGRPDADPPVEARAPELSDVVAALEEFDNKAEEEARKAEEEEVTADEPEKPPMIENAKGPGMKKLPPLPTMPKKPD